MAMARAAHHTMAKEMNGEGANKRGKKTANRNLNQQTCFRATSAINTLSASAAATAVAASAIHTHTNTHDFK